MADLPINETTSFAGMYLTELAANADISTFTARFYVESYMLRGYTINEWNLLM